MRHVAFVAPFFLPATLRFLRGALQVPEARIGLISQDPLVRLPDELRHPLAAHRRVRNAFDAVEVATAVRELAHEMGGIHRLFGPLEQLQVPLAEAREHLGLPGIGVEVAKNFREKSRMKEVLQRHGVPCARHRLAHAPSEAQAFVDEVGFPIVVKPPAGAGAMGTFRLEDQEAFAEALATYPPSPARPWMAEEFMTGAEHSFDTVVIDGRPVWHSLTHYLPTPLEALENPWIQWCVMLPREIDHPRYDDIRQVAFKALAALGIETGLTHMEWFRRPDGSVAVSEVAARPPGAQITPLMSYAHDHDFWRAWSHLMVHDEFDPPPRKYAAGAAFLRGQGTGRVKAIHGLGQAQRELGELVVEATIPELGQSKSSSYEGEGNVVFRHPRTEVVYEALGRFIRMVRVEMA